MVVLSDLSSGHDHEKGTAGASFFTRPFFSIRAHLREGKGGGTCRAHASPPPPFRPGMFGRIPHSTPTQIIMDALVSYVYLQKSNLPASWTAPVSGRHQRH